MHDLQLVGVHDDGEHLVLIGGDGQRYRVPIDEPLRAAVRRDRARLSQLRLQSDGGLRPREIQARIRAGESAEEVARTSALALEHVRRYEGPVLAERAHVADLARRLPARQVPDRPAFGDLVADRLGARGVAEDSVTWDAWRREGTTWTVEVSFRAGSKDRQAQWAYDVQRSHLEALDDESRWLSAPAGREPATPPGRRLTTVSERVYDVEADGGVQPAPGDGSRADGSRADGEEGAGGQRTLELLDALRGRRGRRQPLATPDEDEDDEIGHGEDLLTELLPEAAEPDGHPEPPAAHPPRSRPQDATDADVLALPDAEPDVEPEPVPKPRRASKSSKKARASVPSWDDIVFGAKRE